MDKNSRRTPDGAARPAKLELREYRPSDCRELADLFYHTVRTVNAKDYSKEQVDAWSASGTDLERWDRSLREHFSVVAVKDGVIVGFGDIDRTGYLDRLYVHKDHQGEGIGAAICDRLEQAVRGKIVSHVSITARPFFEKRGFRVIREQRVQRRGVFLTNFVMEKDR